ncbi:transposase [Streptomyces aurantiogriseus]|uniref:transposase n=1 Tax=Streptomyces aurantiogriseus TaxID=66870 RepID=UPI00167BBE9C
MLSRGDLTDREWAVLERLLPVSNNRCGRWRDHRQVIDGIIHRLSTGAQWRKCPNASPRGRPSTTGTCCGRPTAPGRGSCRTSSPLPTPKAALPGTSTSIRPSRALTSTPQEHLEPPYQRRALQKRSSFQPHGHLLPMIGGESSRARQRPSPAIHPGQRPSGPQVLAASQCRWPTVGLDLIGPP